MNTSLTLSPTLEWSNGQVFTFGASADGIAAIQATRTDPAWLSGLVISYFIISLTLSSRSCPFVF
jgi:hypothetical protein